MERESRISVIVPVWQEAAGIVSALGALQGLRAAGAEVIVVDAGSPDGTGALAEPLCDRLVTSRKGRAVQMNAGAAVASGDVLVFLHADTRLPATAEGALAAFARSGRDWGRFDVRLSGRRPLFRVIAWFMNRRSRLTGICTGDQGMFMTRSAFASVGGFPEIPLMEDIEMSRRLRRRSRPFCVADPVVTDSRRWEQRGAWRTIWLMWRLRWRYWRGESPDSLALAYRSDVRHDQP
ncbi:TIGR04283 family arsenosugar biosynthesis glycosyltransferase [Marinobacter sp. C2H3]|uniref:TIGR04283 family arsenosugar biosynthesis glycosyltransferase n=1 Tax=Marinobacter sp. C2H3 TaxID=3119003 RepID=UPI00300E8688